MNSLYKLRCWQCVEIDESIWFANLYFNALIKLNKRTGQIDDIKKFPHYTIDQTWLYSTVDHVEGWLIFTPHKSEEIVSFNIRIHEFRSAELDLNRVGKREGYFGSSYVYKHYVFMFPLYGACILRFDVIQNSVKYLENDLGAVSKESLCFALQYEVVDGKVYIPFAEQNAVAIFDPEKESLCLEVLDIDGGCSTINYVNGCFYMASWKHCRIYRWEKDTGDIFVYEDFPKSFVPGGLIFLRAIIIEKSLFFLPIEANMILSIDMESEKLCEGEKIINPNHESWNVFWGSKVGDKYIIATADNDDFWMPGYIDKRFCLEPYIRLDTAYNKKIISDFIINKGYFSERFENEEMLRKYLGIVENSPGQTKNKKAGNYGKIIWESC